MTCYHPIQAYRSSFVNQTGKRALVFDVSQGVPFSGLKIPCGRCSGCRLERSRQWAIRCVHEGQLYSMNSFITLTFDDEHLLKLCPTGSLDVTLFQDFMKRLRFTLFDKFGVRIRFFHCGEYGEKYGRPHYHACIFGFDFPDKEPFKYVNGIILYRSKLLESVWTFGYSSIGTVTFESAAYVARYIMKKINGKLESYHYEYAVDSDTGEVLMRKPEYTTMSRNPGIASRWFDKYKSDVYPHDFLFLRERKIRPPKYYDGLYEAVGGDLDVLKRKRRFASRKFLVDQTPERLAVREKIQLLKLDMLPRNLDKDL